MAKNSKEVQRRADEKRAGQRTRNWTVIAYPEDLPEDWRERLDEQHIKWVESPLHDRDTNADGTPKKAHYHLMFLFDNVRSCKQVSSWLQGFFGASESGSIVGVATPQQVSDRGALVRYMAHMDNPDKVQYDPQEIVGHGGVDIAGLLRYSALETRAMVVAMEEFIEQHGIVELADFSAAIRYSYPEWHTLLATKMTMYFTGFIKSRRHKATEDVILPKVDKDGVVIE